MLIFAFQSQKTFAPTFLQCSFIHNLFFPRVQCQILKALVELPNRVSQSLLGMQFCGFKC